jgi:uncharacterized protein YqjF (DUF2071 family)
MANEAARERLRQTDGGAFLACHCEQALFLHFAIEPGTLQPHVPCALATHGGLAYVTLLATTIRNLGMQRGDARAPWRLAPLHEQPLVQLRTPVEHRGEAGFFLLQHWLPGSVQSNLQEPRFGLHRQFGWLDLQHTTGAGGRIVSIPRVGVARSALRYRLAQPLPAGDPTAAEPESLDAFLLERYTAFTEDHRVHRCIRCWHEPWRVQPVSVEVEDQGLLASLGPWFASARHCGAHLAPGLHELLIARPQWVPGPGSCWT